MAESENFSEREVARRRDATLLRMLKAPPKPHSAMRLGKPKSKKAKSPSRKSASAKR